MEEDKATEREEWEASGKTERPILDEDMEMYSDKDSEEYEDSEDDASTGEFDKYEKTKTQV